MEGSKNQAGGATYRTPYLLLACQATFDRATKSKMQITKNDLLNTLYIDEGLASSEPNLIVDPLRLTVNEARSLQSSRESIFWFNHRR